MGRPRARQRDCPRVGLRVPGLSSEYPLGANDPARFVVEGEPQPRAKPLHAEIRRQHIGIDPGKLFALGDFDESPEELASHAATLPWVGDEQRELGFPEGNTIPAESTNRDDLAISRRGAPFRDQGHLAVVVDEADPCESLVRRTLVQIYRLHVAHSNALLAERLMKVDYQRFIVGANRPYGDRRPVP